MKILVAGQGIDPDATTYRNCFSDIGNEWYAKYVCYALEKKWVLGYPDGTFRPEQTVTRAEAIKMLITTQGIPVSDSARQFADVMPYEWFCNYVNAGAAKGLIDTASPYFNPNDGMTRSDVSESIFRAIAMKETGKTKFTNDLRSQLSLIADSSASSTSSHAQNSIPSSPLYNNTTSSSSSSSRVQQNSLTQNTPQHSGILTVQHKNTSYTIPYGTKKGLFDEMFFSAMNGDVKVTSIPLKLSLSINNVPRSFINATFYLEVDGSVVQTIVVDGSTYNKEITFSDPSGLFTIPDGGQKDVKFYLDAIIDKESCGADNIDDSMFPTKVGTDASGFGNEASEFTATFSKIEFVGSSACGSEYNWWEN